MLINPFVFKKPAPNTFIGGVAELFPTKEALIASNYYEHIYASNIRNYQVIGNDISFYVNKEYRIYLGFSINTLTYYIDKGGRCVSVGQSSFNSSSLNFVYLPKMKNHDSSGGYMSFTALSSYYKYFSLPELTNATETYVQINSLLNNNSFETLNLSKLTNLGLQNHGDRRSLSDLSNLSRLDISSVVRVFEKTIGSTIGYPYFDGLKTGCVVILNSAMMSLGEITPHPFASKLIANGAVVRYKTNNIAPNAVSDLNVTEITSNGCTVNFSTPLISENNIDYYEVWADDGVHIWKNLIHRDEITATGAVITSLEPNKTYKMTLVTKDEFFNASEHSNEVTFTTIANLYTQNDAASPIPNETDTVGAGWSAISDIILSTDIAQNSSRSLKFLSTSTRSNRVDITISGLEIGETYRITADVRCEDDLGNDGKGFFRTKNPASSNGWQSSSYFDILSKNWQTLSFDAVATDTSGTLQLFPSWNDSTGAVADGWATWFDNIRIEKISTTPPPTPLVKAFPTAEGFGKNATGGRGGTVIKVTNLNNSGSGSLREALSASGTRTVIFDVSGTITLTSPINLTNGNVTIAGQSAPGQGITIKGGTLSIEASNVILRHLRFRTGDTGSGFNDSISVTAWGSSTVENVIIDHCSMSWAEDEVFECRIMTADSIVRNVTLQNSIISEGLYASLFSGISATSTSEGINKVTFYQNLYAQNSQRHPRVGWPVDGDFSAEFINNIVYGFSEATGISFGSKVSIINNLYKLSSEITPNSGVPIISVTTSGQRVPASTDIYLEGNIIPSGMNLITTGSEYLTTVPAASSGIVPVAANAINILSHVGCSVPFRDSVDDEMISNYNAGVGTLTPYPFDPNYYVWPVIASVTRNPSEYINNPYIPEVWFSANVPSGQDHNDIAPSGYTWLEEYLNQVDN